MQQQIPPQPSPGDPSFPATQPLRSAPAQQPDSSYTPQPQQPMQPPAMPETSSIQQTQPAMQTSYQTPDVSSVQQVQPSTQTSGAPFAQPLQAQQQSAAIPRVNWITFSQLRGHPLVDLAEGVTIGKVNDLLFDEHRRIIQAFATKGSLLHGPTYVPALKARIGLDAVTFEPGTLAGQDTSWLDKLPKAADLIGMRVLSDRGRLLGAVNDLRIDPSNGMLLAFELAPESPGILHRLGSGRRLLPATSVISYGPDTIIAIEGSMTEI